MNYIERLKEWLFGTRETEAPILPPSTMVPPELFREIRNLKVQADWMGRLLEDDMTGESGFLNGLDGTDYWGLKSQSGGIAGMFNYGWAFAQCIFRPAYGAAFYINEAQYRFIRARSRAFCSVNPYWHGVIHNLKTHVIGKGHNWHAVSALPGVVVPEKIINDVQKDLDDFYKAGYREIQKEKTERKSRDGEAFLRFSVKDGKLRVNFVEPLLVWNPPNKSEAQDCLFGIQYARGNYEEPLGYHLRRTDYLGADNGASLAAWEKMVPADKIQHLKVNVDRGTPRGIPDTYWTQTRLEQSLKTLRATGLLVQVRSKVAMIRKRTNALMGSVQPMLSQNAVATIHTPSGQSQSVMEWPDAAIFDTSDQAEYSMPSANLEIKEAVSAIHADLQSAASSMGLADYMVSGTLGTGGSYAVSMVAEGPVVKTFEDYQSDMIDEDDVVTDKIIDTGIEYGRYPEETKELVKVEKRGPPLARISVQEAQTMQIEIQEGVLSKKTARQLRGYDNATEEANIAAEKEADAKQQHELSVKYPEPMPMPGAGPSSSGSGNGKSNGSTQPRNRMGASARPFRPDDEGRQMQRSSGATVEDLFERFMAERLQESSHDHGHPDQPTNEDIAMAKAILTDDWKAATKAEILALPNFAHCPRLDAAAKELEPGVKGIYLGMVDKQKVYAVDPDGVMIKYKCADFVVAGNSEKWKGIVPDDLIYIDWSYNPIDAAHDCLHECGEYRLMQAGWAYVRAHKYANWGPGMEMDWLLELRSDLAPYFGVGVTEQTEKDKTT